MFIVYAIIIFAILIFVHEFGHLIAAKLLDMRVNEFALGMGPAIFKKSFGETQYSLRVLPIGGYCALEGEDEESDDPRSFMNKSAPKRAIVLAAGSFMNLLLAIVLLSIVIFSIGTPGTQIKDIEKGSPAQIAGLMPGDKIIDINDKEIIKWDDVPGAIASSDGEEIIIRVERDNQVQQIAVEYYIGEDGTKKIGISPVFVKTPSHAIKSFYYGANATWNMTKEIFRILGGLFTKDVSINDFTGPVGIVNAVGDTAKMGFAYVAQLTALISLNLAIINMLPIPALDGGKLLFMVIRKLTGKTITDRTENIIHLIGFMLLIGLMIYITFIDVGRLL